VGVLVLRSVNVTVSPAVMLVGLPWKPATGGVGVGVGVAVGVGPGVGVGVPVGAGVMVCVGDPVGDGAGVAVAFGTSEGVGAGVAVAFGTSVGVGVAFAGGWPADPGFVTFTNRCKSLYGVAILPSLYNINISSMLLPTLLIVKLIFSSQVWLSDKTISSENN
jgi:hypothetical protein